MSPRVFNFAADFSGWWLPANYSRHGVSIDALFMWIFWITMTVLIGVEGLLVAFLVRYRRRPGKARFTHGNARVEIVWTIVPAMILAGLALASKRVWDNYRYSTDLNDPRAVDILVIGQQFKWNIIYPGKDGKLGRYLVFPKPTDVEWPHRPGDAKHLFAGVPGPASLSYEQAVEAINQFISQTGAEYQLGKDWSDPQGVDDDFRAALARTMVVPVNRPVRVWLASRDVIHDFYLPNFRVQLYAVPGMMGQVTFTATKTTKEIEAASRRTYDLDELAKQPANEEYDVAIDENTPGATLLKLGNLKFWRYAGADQKTIVRDGGSLRPEIVAKLKAAGITNVTAYRPGTMELVCAQLCGAGHYTMRGQIVVVSEEEFAGKVKAE